MKLSERMTREDERHSGMGGDEVLVEYIEGWVKEVAQLEAENEALKRGFVYTSENGRKLLVRMWNDEPWIFYKHPDGQWVSLRKITLLTGGDK